MVGRLTQVRARVVQLRPEEVGSESDSHCSGRRRRFIQGGHKEGKGKSGIAADDFLLICSILVMRTYHLAAARLRF